VAARESLERWRAGATPDAQEAVRVADLAYRGGAESYLFVLDASRRLLDARAGEIQALADLRRAQAQLERNTGRKRAVTP
jgi:cobalt-zinc-cadmium efflux system outer membrane protein